MTSDLTQLGITQFGTGDLTDAELRDLAARQPLEILLDKASQLRDTGHGRLISYSRKVFIPLTHLCRDVCHYCTFAHPPREGEAAYLSPDQVLAIARAGAKAGCKEALFTLGDKPELRYRAAREALNDFGYDTTLSYVGDMCRLVFEEARFPQTPPCPTSATCAGWCLRKPGFYPMPIRA